MEFVHDTWLYCNHSANLYQLVDTSNGMNFLKKTIFTIIAVLGFGFAIAILGSFALSIGVRVLVFCVFPSIVYLPIRLLFGAPLLPTHSIVPIRLGNSSSRFDFLFVALLVACFRGFLAVLVVLFFFGCVITPLGLLESFLSIKILPVFRSEVIWPVIGVAFFFGVARAAARDVKEERAALSKLKA